MLRIAIVDDDVNFQKQIREFIARFFNHEASQFSVRCYCDGVEFLSEYQCDVDIVIIDIMMPMMNGIEVARKLREHDKDVLVMFITATADFAIRGYEVSAVDYILKPLSYETDFKYKFDRVVKKANALKVRSRELVLKDENGRFVKLDVNDLIYVAKDRDNALYHTRQGVFSERIPMFKVKEALQGEAAFALVNSGCIVNMAFVNNIKDNLIEMMNGDLLVLSRSKKKAFYEGFFVYMGN